MRRRLLLGSLLALLCAGLALQRAAPARALSGTRITINGQQAFLTGANLPWYNWGCDFGCGDTGNPATSGVSNATVAANVGAAFATAKAAGMHVIRWWLFEGSAASQDIATDNAGVPTQITRTTYADIDAALAVANQYDIYLDFVLFSAPTAVPQNWVTDPGTAAGLATTIGSLAAHYAGNPRVFTWEVYNEPEVDIWAGRIDQASVQASVKNIAAAIHANSSAYVTVGSVMLDGLPLWVGLGLDYYEAHWYDYMNQGNYDAYLWDYATVKARYALDAPLVLGEFPATPQSASPAASARWQHWYSAGYAGAWVWSLLPTHTADQLAVDTGAVTALTTQHTDTAPQQTLDEPGCLTADTGKEMYTAAKTGTAAGLARVLALYDIWKVCLAGHPGYVQPTNP
jgi:hypothetical protein